MSGMSRCRSSKILTKPGRPPLGEASHQPSRLLVAITIKGDWRMKALTGSGKASLTLLATLSEGWPNCWLNGLSKLGSKVAMRYASCRASACSCDAGIQGDSSWRHSKRWIHRVSTPRYWCAPSQVGVARHRLADHAMYFSCGSTMRKPLWG